MVIPTRHATRRAAKRGRFAHTVTQAKMAPSNLPTVVVVFNELAGGKRRYRHSVPARCGATRGRCCSAKTAPVAQVRGQVGFQAPINQTLNSQKLYFRKSNLYNPANDFIMTAPPLLQTDEMARLPS